MKSQILQIQETCEHEQHWARDTGESRSLWAVMQKSEAENLSQELSRWSSAEDEDEDDVKCGRNTHLQTSPFSITAALYCHSHD